MFVSVASFDGDFPLCRVPIDIECPKSGRSGCCREIAFEPVLFVSGHLRDKMAELISCYLSGDSIFVFA